MAQVQCPFDGITLKDDAMTQEQIDAELDAHLQKHHGVTLLAVRTAEASLPRKNPYHEN